FPTHAPVFPPVVLLARQDAGVDARRSLSRPRCGDGACYCRRAAIPVSTKPAANRRVSARARARGRSGASRPRAEHAAPHRAFLRGAEATDLKAAAAADPAAPVGFQPASRTALKGDLWTIAAAERTPPSAG